MMAEVGMAEAIQVLRAAKISRDRRLLYHNIPLTSEKLRAVIDTAILRANGLAARTIVAGFHSEEAAQAADENWAKQFQQGKDDGEGIEEVHLSFADLVGPSSPAGMQIRMPKLLVKAGLADSGAEASRKLAENAVKLNGNVVTSAIFPLDSLPARITIRVGKRAKVAVIE